MIPKLPRPTCRVPIDFGTEEAPDVRDVEFELKLLRELPNGDVEIHAETSRIEHLSGTEGEDA